MDARPIYDVRRAGVDVWPSLTYANDSPRQALDLHLPQIAEPHAVLVSIHIGAFMFRDRRHELSALALIALVVGLQALTKLAIGRN